jgi:hypothetical protein
MSLSIVSQKRESEIIPAASNDHHAVVLHISLDVPHRPTGKGLWKLNNKLLSVEEIQARFVQDWNRWRTTQDPYANLTHWWTKYAKRRILAFFQAED